MIKKNRLDNKLFIFYFYKCTLMTVEAVKGEEFITFFQGTADLQPSHCAMLPFARNVFDPMDFTPMILDSIPNLNRKTTPAFELALPVLFIVMARKKDNIWHLVGINGENSPKEIEIDLSFVSGKKGIVITEGENGFKLENITTAGNTKLTVKMKPFGGFVAKF